VEDVDEEAVEVLKTEDWRRVEKDGDDC